MTNLQESRSKIGGKLFMKRIIGSEFLENKWNTDVRKFSRNFEISQFFNDYRIGGTAESNLIFSERSYIPRSGMLNLTLSLFGENVNLFEVGARIEGFEDMLQDMFGPDGFFREDTVHNFLKTLSSRNKRETQDSKLKKIKNDFGSRVKDDHPRGNMYMRFFGQDIKYSSFNGVPSTLSNLFQNPMNIFGLSFEDTDFDHERSTMFLDGSIIIPTVAGLPLNMTAKGTSSLRLKSKTKINLKEFRSAGKASAEAEIYPSATIEVSGVMSVDAFVTKTGLKSVTKIHTSTFLGGRVDIHGTKLAQVQIKVPREKLEMFEASADFFTFKSGYFKEIDTYQKQEVLDHCSPKYFSDVFGLETCGRISYYHGRSKGDPSWFFAGPSKAELIVRKMDNFDNIIFKYSWIENDKNKAKGMLNDIHVIYDTPQSSVNRKSLASVKYDEHKTFFDVDLIIPARNIKVGFKYDWTRDKKGVVAGISIDNTDILKLTQKIVKERDKYEGETKFVYFDDQMINWSWTLYSKSGKYSLDANLDSTFHDKIKLSGDVTRLKRDDKIKIEGKIQSSIISVDMSSNCRISENVYSIKGNANYKLFDGKFNRIDFAGKVSKTAQGELETQNLYLDFNVSSRYYSLCFNPVYF